MKFRILTLLILAPLALASCASLTNRNTVEARKEAQAGFEARLNSYKGKRFDVLVADLGMPRRTMSLPGGGRIVEYTEAERTVAKNRGHGIHWGYGFVTTRNDETQVHQRCIYSFTLDKSGVVTRTLYEGNCY